MSLQSKLKENVALTIVLELAAISALIWVFMVISNFKDKNSLPTQIETQLKRNGLSEKQISQAENSGVVLGEKNIVLGESDTNQNIDLQMMDLSSESFKMKQLSVGGEVVVQGENGNDDGTPLVVSDIRSELMTSKDKDKIKLLVSWKTSKPADSQAEYAQEGDGNTKNLHEDKYGYSHALVLSDLEPGAVYTYRIKSKDRIGTEKISDKFVFYTGAPSVSLMDVLENSVSKVFGWAMKKS